MWQTCRCRTPQIRNCELRTYDEDRNFGLAATAVLATAARVAAQASEPATTNVRLIFMPVPPSLLSVFTRPNYRARYDRPHPVLMPRIRPSRPPPPPPPPPPTAPP